MRVVETGKYQLSEVVDCIRDLAAMERDMIRAGIRYGIASIRGGYALLREPVKVLRKVSDWETVQDFLVGDAFTGKAEIDIDGWVKPFKLHKGL